MAVTVTVSNHTKHKAYEQFVRDVITLTLVAVVPQSVQTKEIVVSYAIVTPTESKKANNALRQKDGETDILSLGEYATIEEVRQSPQEHVALGELIVCYDVIAQSATQDGVHFLHELSFVVSHGVLHLLGYAHSEKMFTLQDEVCKKMINSYVLNS